MTTQNSGSLAPSRFEQTIIGALRSRDNAPYATLHSQLPTPPSKKNLERGDRFFI